MIDSLIRGDVLIDLARAAITEKLGLPSADVNDADATWLQDSAATFVTLTIDGKLRGCIGSLQVYRSMISDVQANAVAAAFHDPRFSALTKEEYASIQVEVSVLSDMEPIHARNENIALSKIRQGIDGVVFKYGAHSATFLPQVWSQLPDPEQFMSHLKQKAGLPPDFWHPEVLLYKYQVSKYREQEKYTE